MNNGIIEKKRQLFAEKIKAEGFEIIGLCVAGKYSQPTEYYEMKFPCGHIQDVRKTHFMSGVIKCRRCIEIKHEKIVKEYGLEIPDHALLKKNTQIKRMKFTECGHTLDITIGHLEKIEVYCRQCEPDRGHLGGQSCLYVWEFHSPYDNFIKFGYARDPHVRKRQYNVSSAYTAQLSMVLPMNTTHSALRLEKQMHKEYKQYRLDPKKMKSIMDNGFTECYPYFVVDFFVEDLYKENEKLGHDFYCSRDR